MNKLKEELKQIGVICDIVKVDRKQITKLGTKVTKVKEVLGK